MNDDIIKKNRRKLKLFAVAENFEISEVSYESSWYYDGNHDMYFSNIKSDDAKHVFAIMYSLKGFAIMENNGITHDRIGSFKEFTTSYRNIC